MRENPKFLKPGKGKKNRPGNLERMPQLRPGPAMGGGSLGAAKPNAQQARRAALKGAMNKRRMGGY